MCITIFKKNNNTVIDPLPSPTPAPTNIVNSIWTDLKPIDITKIKRYAFPENKYFHNEYEKTQIVLHHTISGSDIDGNVSTWINGKYNVGTCIIIDGNGIPWQIFESKYWAYHLGTGNHSLDKHSIGIEIDNWGGLIFGDGTVMQFDKKPIQTIRGKYYAYYGNIVDVPLQEYTNGYRGYKTFQKYTNEQIATVGELLLFWKNTYGVSLFYNASMFDISQEALGGKPGVWTHTSYRQDKSDIHPQPEMIEMLKSLSPNEMPVSFKLKRRRFHFGRRKGLDAENQ
jgi:hypothetical protein